MLVQAAVDVLLVVAALQVLEMGQSGVGWLSAAWGAGGLAGGAAAMALLRRGRLAWGLVLTSALRPDRPEPGRPAPPSGVTSWRSAQSTPGFGCSPTRPSSP